MTHILVTHIGLRLAFVVGLVCCMGHNAAAQESPWSVGEPIQLVGEDGDDFIQPRWSPAGDRLAFTGAKYEGIWVASLEESEARQITAESAAGFGFSWSEDGVALLTRVARYEGIRRYNAVKIFDVDTDQTRQLTEYRTQMTGMPQWTSTGQVALYNHEVLEELDSGRIAPANKQPRESPVYVPAGMTVAKVDPKGTALAPIGQQEEGAVLNLIVSPDGSRLAYEVMGGGLVLMRTDGSDRMEVGRGHRPRWSPDSQWVVYMITEDDGHEFTSSDLYVTRADGKTQVRLTKTDRALEMNPDWSPDGRFIAYDDQGVIHLLPISEK